MRSLAFVSKKGGVGKTTLAHLACLGSAWRGVEAHLLHTDDRDPVEANGRPYDIYDAREEDDLIFIFNKLEEQPKGILCLDAGGNRPEFDKWIAQVVDLVVIPVTLDCEDIRVGMQHYDELAEAAPDSNIKFVINRYPGTVGRYDMELLSMLPRDLVLGRLGEARAARTLRDNDPEGGFTTPPTNVNNMARKLYGMVQK